MTKYHSVKVRTPDGQVFDSKRELARYTDLKLLEAADAKGVRTREYVIKRKLMLYNKGIHVREV